MVTVKQLKEELGMKMLTSCDDGKEIAKGYICDLLSWVMAKGQEKMAWITVQTHLNVIAVACLHDFACVIIPENIEVPQESIEKANEEGICVLSSEKDAYEIAIGMAKLGIEA